MTGHEILTGLSFVDERFIQEAETARLGRSVPWMKILSVAACLCILIVGVMAMDGLLYGGAKESMVEAAPQAAPEAAAPEAAPEACPEEIAPEAAPEAEMEAVTIPGELHQIPYARLRIVKVLDDGSFAAVVEEISEAPTLFVVGMQVTVIIDPAMIPQTDRTDTTYENAIAEDMMVEIRCGTFDAGINTLYVEGVISVD